VPEDRQHVNVTSTMFPKNEDPSLKPPRELVARIYVLEDILDKCSPSLDREYFDLNSIHSCAYVSASLRTTLGLKIGSKVIMQMIEENERPRPSSVNVFPSDRSVTLEVFKNYVKLHSRHEPLLLNSGATILFDGGERCVVVRMSADCDYATIDGKDAEDLVIFVPSESDPSDGKISRNCPEEQSRMEKISTR